MTSLNENLKQKYVYHGSDIFFDSVVPKRQIRAKIENGERKVKFDEISFHATPHKWIAIAYICKIKSFQIDKQLFEYNMAVDLYTHRKELIIFGINSLEESLDKLFGEGGYILTFKKEDFFYMEGLGNLEVITKKTIKPLRIEFIKNPVEKLRGYGVSFKFIDLLLPENKKYLNFT